MTVKVYSSDGRQIDEVTFSYLNDIDQLIKYHLTHDRIIVIANSDLPIDPIF